MQMLQNSIEVEVEDVKNDSTSERVVWSIAFSSVIYNGMQLESLDGVHLLQQCTILFFLPSV